LGLRVLHAREQTHHHRQGQTGHSAIRYHECGTGIPDELK
jgi:hypothetical protein